MDCRETQDLLTAFHDGELPAADRARVEEHLRGCRDCGALLAGLARADQAAGVPDPGPAYWDRFNARVIERVEREADGPGVAVLRPKGGWMRRQFRYIVPAAAAAALVAVVVRYGGMNPGAPIPSAPPAVSAPAPPVPAVERMAEAEPESRAAKRAEPAAVARRVPEESKRVAKAPAAPPPAIAGERLAAVTREERDRLADRSRQARKGEASRDHAGGQGRPGAKSGGDTPGSAAPAEPAAIGVPSPPPTMFQRAPDGQGWPDAGAGRDATGSVAPAAGSPPSTAAPAYLTEERQAAGKAKSSSGTRLAKEASPASPCERARALAGRERFREAEDAQRACLAGELPEPAREKGLVFLAELLDRQARFADADAVIEEVDRRFPQSRPLDLYRQQRPMVQKKRIQAPNPR